MYIEIELSLYNRKPPHLLFVGEMSNVLLLLFFLLTSNTPARQGGGSFQEVRTYTAKE
jgi:hypothetical protein